MNLSSVDRAEHLSVVYLLHSMTHLHKIALRVDVPRATPVVPTVEGVWITAQWHEREAYDLMGIVFDGNRDLRRILLPDDWEGHPLRKDYQVQEFYRGMKVPY
jgi:NADH-quinone oxidoreductase subunit C